MSTYETRRLELTLTRGDIGNGRTGFGIEVCESDEGLAEISGLHAAAQHSSLHKGDTIVEVNTVQTPSLKAASDAIKQSSDTLWLTVERKVALSPERRKSTSPSRRSSGGAKVIEFDLIRGETGFGLEINYAADSRSPEQGTVITALHGGARSAAHRQGVRTGDKIIAVNGRETETLDLVTDAIRSSPDELRLTLERPPSWWSAALSKADEVLDDMFGLQSPLQSMGEDQLGEMLRAQDTAEREQAQQALLAASQEGDLARVEQLLADSRRLDLDEANGVGDTALIKACWYGFPEVVRVLIANGARPDPTNLDGNSALNCAAYQGFHDIVRLLLEHRAPLEQRDAVTGKTALIKAAYMGHSSTAELLLRAGAPPNSADDQGYTALAFAVSFDHTPVVKILLREAADPNVRDIFGITPLIHAAARGHAHHVRAMLEAGANPTLADNENQSAIDYAQAGGFVDVLALLRQAGASQSRAAASGGDITPRTPANGGLATPRVPVSNTLSLSEAAPGGGSSLGSPAVFESPGGTTYSITAKNVATLDCTSLHNLSCGLVRVAKLLAKRDTSTEDAQYPTYALQSSRVAA